MGLVGDSSELSLLDLIQVKGQGPGTCRILVHGRDGAGSLFVDAGFVVFAEYGDLVGEQAAHALVLEDAVAYRATSDVAVPPANMSVEHRALLLQAAVLSDEAKRWPGSARSPRGATPPVRRRSTPSPQPHPVRRLVALLGPLVLGVAVVAIGVAIFGTVTVKRNEAAAAAQTAPPAAPPPQPAAPLEASALAGPRDALPVLLSGEPPRSPAPDVALRPTVVLRLLVDETGGVRRADVYQPRPDLAAFEQAALRAAGRFAFRPAQRDGAPVAVWINWPVDFI